MSDSTWQKNGKPANHSKPEMVSIMMMIIVVVMSHDPHSEHHHHCHEMSWVCASSWSWYIAVPYSCFWAGCKIARPCYEVKCKYTNIWKKCDKSCNCPETSSNNSGSQSYQRNLQIPPPRLEPQVGRYRHHDLYGQGHVHLSWHNGGLLVVALSHKAARDQRKDSRLLKTNFD